MRDSIADDILTDNERIEWLRLSRSENVGPRTFRILLEHCGSVTAALQALPGLARRGGGAMPRICSQEEAERELAAARAIGVTFVAWNERGYPARLREIDGAPPLLAVRGNAEVLARPAIAIVGSRNASGAGLKVAERLARALGEAGFAVVSGLARGIDAAAHRASLDTGTIAVLAGGQDHIYPPEHEELAAAVMPAGAAVTEMPMGWAPRARDFPRRNRLISGLSLGVVVVEAARRSGSLITARFALEQGREVFAVPGSPLDPRSEGTNGLLKQGATLVTEAADIITVLEPILGRRLPPSEGPSVVEEPSSPTEASDEARTRIVELLGPAPITLDDLVRLAQTSPAVVRTMLLELELAGRLRRHSGGSVSSI